MEIRKSLINSLMIGLIFSIFSCNNNKNTFYQKIKDNNDCIIAWEIVYAGENPITIVMEKSDFIAKFNRSIDDDYIIKTIKSGKPFSVSKTIYKTLYNEQVISQPRVDSLMNIGIDNFFIENQDKVKLLKLSKVLTNATSDEELYAIKKLFRQNILLKQDCESGFYIEIE